MRRFIFLQMLALTFVIRLPMYAQSPLPICDSLWLSTRYIPGSAFEILGRFGATNGFCGDRYEFFKGDSFYYESWSDVVALGSREPTYVGHFRISQDTLVLQHELEILDTAQTQVNFVRVFLIKQVQTYLFLISPAAKDTFCSSTLENGGLPEIFKLDGLEYGNPFLLKIKPHPH